MIGSPVATYDGELIDIHRLWALMSSPRFVRIKDETSVIGYLKSKPIMREIPLIDLEVALEIKRKQVERDLRDSPLFWRILRHLVDDDTPATTASSGKD
jgi:hypothetical protein